MRLPQENAEQRGDDLLPKLLECTFYSSGQYGRRMMATLGPVVMSGDESLLCTCLVVIRKSLASPPPGAASVKCRLLFGDECEP